MTDAVYELSTPPASWRQLAARLGRWLSRVILERTTRRALGDLPDEMLRDIGVARGEIDFIAGAVSAGKGDPTREAAHYLNAGKPAGCYTPSPRRPS